MSHLNFRRKSLASRPLLFLFTFCLCVGSMLFCFSRQAEARATGTVKNSILNVRSSASTSSSILCKLTKGTKVTIISETTGDDGLKWYDVFFAYNSDAKEGFVRADLLNVSGSVSGSTGTSGSGSSSTSSGSKYVKPSVAIIRTYASTSADIRSRLEKGTGVTVLSSTKGSDGMTWYKISFTKDGAAREGYIRGDLLTDTNPGGSSAGSGSSTDVSGIRYIKGDIVRIRTYASISADIRSRLTNGTPVTLLSSTKGSDGMTWYKVSYKDNGYSLNGYVRSDLLSGESAGIPSAPGSSGNGGSAETPVSTPASIRPMVANIRTCASTSGDIRSKLSQGTGVTIIASKTGDDGMKWYKISYTFNDHKLEGYIRSDLLNVGSTAGSGSSSSGAVAQVYTYASPYADVRTTLQNGTKVTVLSEKTGEDGEKWTKISFTQNGEKLQGYVPSSLLK